MVLARSGQSRLPALCHVLLVEDDSIIAKATEAMLGDLGDYIVHSTSAMADALNIIGNHPIDIAIINLDDCYQDGVLIAKQLFASGTPVVFSTALDLDLPFLGDAVRVLRKPYVRGDLQRLLP